jgi:hypothetical protein
MKQFQYYRNVATTFCSTLVEIRTKGKRVVCIDTDACIIRALFYNRSTASVRRSSGVCEPQHCKFQLHQEMRRSRSSMQNSGAEGNGVVLY